MSHGFQHNGTPGSLSGEEDMVAKALESLLLFQSATDTALLFQLSFLVP